MLSLYGSKVALFKRTCLQNLDDCKYAIAASSIFASSLKAS